MMAKSLLKKAIIQTESGDLERWFVCNPYLPVMDVCDFLNAKSLRSSATGKTYGSVLVLWMNFLDKLGRKYNEATFGNVRAFIHSVGMGISPDPKILSLAPQLTMNSMKYYIIVLRELYYYLDCGMVPDDIPIMRRTRASRNKAKHSYLYGSIWETEINTYLGMVNILSLKTRKKKITHFTSDQIERLLTAFKNLRDKAVFSLLLEGLRTTDPMKRICKADKYGT